VLKDVGIGVCTFDPGSADVGNRATGDDLARRRNGIREGANRLGELGNSVSAVVVEQ